MYLFLFNHPNCITWKSEILNNMSTLKKNFENRSASGEEEAPQELFFYHMTTNKIMPNNERTEKMRRERQEMEQMKLLQEEQELKAQQVSIKNDKERKDQLKARLQAEQERKLRQESKQREEELILADLKGNFGRLLQDLKDNVTPLEMHLTGFDYSSPEKRLLFKAIETNSSLKVHTPF